jgi:HEAT repeat protein
MSGKYTEAWCLVSLFVALSVATGSGGGAGGDADRRDLERQVDEALAVLAHPEARGKNIEMTRKAFQVLRRIGKPAVPKVVQAVLDFPEALGASAYAALALEKIGAPAVEGVRAAWPKLTEAQKWKFMRFRGRFDYKASLDFALASLRSKDEAVARQAVVYVCAHKEAKARAPLLKILASGPPYLRWEVVEGMAEYGDREAAKELIPLLKEGSWATKGEDLKYLVSPPPDWWPDGRKCVIDTLEKLKTKEAAPALLAMLQEKGMGKAYLGEDIMPLLGEWGYKESIPELRRILQAEGKYLSILAAKVLWQLGDRSGWLALRKAIDNDSFWVRRDACEAFGRFGDKSDLWVLATCLDDPDQEVRRLASEGMGRITGVTSPVPRGSPYDETAWKAWWDKNQEKYRNAR